MPNHVKNKIEFVGDIAVIEKIFSEFNTHIPAELNRTHDGELIICREKDAGEWSVGWFNQKTGEFSQGHGEDRKTTTGLPEGWEFEVTPAIDRFPDFNKVTPQPENIFNGDLGQKEKEMCAKEGRPNWSDWNPANWGTKWNSYSHEKKSYNAFTFETAWSGVPVIIAKMSEKFPELKIYYTYSDEDFGYNCGALVFQKGETVFDNIPKGGSNEAYEIAFSLRPDRKEDYTLVDGKWEYKEE